MFLAEVGVGVVYFLHFPDTTECGDVTKTRSSLLVLHFRNAATFLMLAQGVSRRRYRAINNYARSMSGRLVTLSYEARSSVASWRAGSIHLPCSRIKSFSRSTASASGMLNFTAVLPT